MKPSRSTVLAAVLFGLLACTLAGCADKPKPRDARQDSARLSKEPMDPTDLNGRILRGIGLP